MNLKQRHLLEDFAMYLHARSVPIMASDSPDDSWILALEANAGAMFPTLFFELATRYSFGEFDCGGIIFLANTVMDGNTYSTLPITTFEDSKLSRQLHQNGLLQFGYSESGSYDPVCFGDGRHTRRDRGLVQIDHEAIFLNSKIRIVRTITKSFREFVQTVLAQN